MSTVLVIDDEAPMRKMLRTILESAGHQVIEAPNGLVGVKEFRDHKPDLVITDLVMPEQEGLQTIHDIRKIDPQAKVVAISGGGRNGYMQFLEVAEGFGAAASVRKPFRRDEILSVVRRVLAASDPTPPGAAKAP